MNSISEILGDFHPLSVHFPIGIYAVLLVLEILHHFKKYKLDHQTRVVLQWLALLSTIAAAFFGWQNAESRSFPGGDKELLEIHEKFAYVMLLNSVYGLFVLYKSKLLAYKISLVIALICISIGGHFGSTLVHGEVTLLEMFLKKPVKDHIDLSKVKPSKNIDIPAEQDQKVSYLNTIKVIFETYCYKCHGEEKQKGDFRMDREDQMLEKVVAGDPSKSEIYQLITLPEDHEDLMPPKKGPLSPENIGLIKEWILQGAKTDH